MRFSRMEKKSRRFPNLRLIVTTFSEVNSIPQTIFFVCFNIVDFFSERTTCPVLDATLVFNRCNPRTEHGCTNDANCSSGTKCCPSSWDGACSLNCVKPRYLGEYLGTYEQATLTLSSKRELLEIMLHVILQNVDLKRPLRSLSHGYGVA